MKAYWFWLAAVLILATQRAPAADISWRTAANGGFQNPGRWLPNVVPGPADRALFSLPGSYNVSFSANAQNLQAVVTAGSVIWDFNARSYTLSGNPGSTFDLGLDVTALTAATQLTIRDGTLVTSGARVDGLAGAVGTLLVEANGPLTVTGDALVVGDFGAGILTLPTGASIASDFAVVGFEEQAVGAVTVIGLGAVWNNTVGTSSHTLRVASSGTGSLHVESGAAVQTGQLIIADLVSGQGLVEVVGDGSTLSASDFIFVGYEGFGDLDIDDGAIVNSLGGELGSLFGATGVAVIEGTGSQWNIAGTLNLGLQGIGSINMVSGGQLTSGLSIVGQGTVAAGEAVLIGSGTRWDAAQQIQLGQSGFGMLTVSAGAAVTSLKAASASGSSGILGVLPTGRGVAIVTDSGTSWTGDGLLSVGFGGDGQLDVLQGGLVQHAEGAIGRAGGAIGLVNVMDAGSRLEFATSLAVAGSSTAAGGIGTLNVGAGASVAAGQLVRIWTSGAVALSGGTLDTATLDIVQGRLEGGGTINADVSNSGTVLPDGTGGPLLVNGDFVQSATGTLEIELSGLTTFGRLDVRDAAQWSGALRFTTTGGFIPPPGTLLAVVEYGSSSGSFSSIQGLVFGTQAEQFFSLASDSASITLYAPLLGDANLDRTVSGADFTIWADHFGQSGVWNAGDFNGDAQITGADFTIWADHFGEMAVPSSHAVPEPATACLAAALAIPAILAMRRARRATPAEGRAPARRPPVAARS